MEKILEKFESKNKSDIERILVSGQLGEKQATLLKLLFEDAPIEQMIRDGIEQLPDEEHRPDEKLARYFFVISELKSITQETRDLALDAMVYCKNTGDTPTGNKENITVRSKKIGAPLS